MSLVCVCVNEGKMRARDVDGGGERKGVATSDGGKEECLASVCM